MKRLGKCDILIFETVAFEAALNAPLMIKLNKSALKSLSALGRKKCLEI